MVVQINLLVMVTGLHTQFGGTLCPSLFGGIFLGTDLGDLIFDFRNFCFL